MELGRFFKGMEDVNGDDQMILGITDHWQILVVILMMASAIFLVKFGRKGLATRQEAVNSLSSRLAEIDPADYDFDGNRKAADEPSVNFDDFFSNASRREEIGGAAVADQHEPAPPMQAVTKPAPAAAPTVFPIPTLADLPAPDPQEPAVTREARDRLSAITSAAKKKLEADPDYVLTEEENFASSALESYRFCADGLGYFMMKAPDLPRFRAIGDVARTIGAADLETVIGLQVRLMEITSTPEWRERDQDDERWYPIHETCDRLNDLFREVNRSSGGTGRMTTLADAYLAGEW